MNKQSKKQLQIEEANCVALTETEIKNIDGGHRGGGSSGRSGGSNRNSGGGQQHAHCGQSRGRDASWGGGYGSGKTGFA